MRCARMRQGIFGGDCSRIARIRAAWTSVGPCDPFRLPDAAAGTWVSKVPEIPVRHALRFGPKICLQSCTSSVAHASSKSHLELSVLELSESSELGLINILGDHLVVPCSCANRSGWNTYTSCFLVVHPERTILEIR